VEGDLSLMRDTDNQPLIRAADTSLISEPGVKSCETGWKIGEVAKRIKSGGKHRMVVLR